MKILFGVLPDGREVYEYTLRNRYGIEISVINLGGIITSIKIPNGLGSLINIVAGFKTLHDYLIDTNYIGAIVGRCANRINNASFNINSHVYKLSKNHGSIHHHGGLCGFNSVFWEIESNSSKEGDELILTYTSVDGEEGYPGNLKVTVTYNLTDTNELKIRYNALSDKDTIFNPTQHSYFNLSGDFNTSIHTHLLQINSNSIVDVDSNVIPTGEFLQVDNTPFDYRKTKEVGVVIASKHKQIENVGGGLDHTFIVNNSNEPALHLINSDNTLSLTVYTTEPGVHVYTGNFLNTDVNSTIKYTPYSAIAIETQHFPDSVHHSHFPSVLLKKGDVFVSETRYVFGVNSSN